MQVDSVPAGGNLYPFRGLLPLRRSDLTGWPSLFQGSQHRIRRLSQAGSRAALLRLQSIRQVTAE